MSNIVYTKIATEATKDILCLTQNHCSGHIRLFFKQDDKHLITILGHNEKYDNVTSFGGFADPNETLLDTLLREYMEESLGAVTTEQMMKDLLLKECTIIHRKSNKGDHYTVFCIIDNISFDIKTIRTKFKHERSKPNLNSGQKENDDIVFVGLDTITNAFGENLSADVIVENTERNKVTIRGINMPAYKWFADALEKSKDK